MSNSCKIFNAHRWVRSLPPIKKWDSDFISTLICSNSNGSALHLYAFKSKNVEYSSIHFSIRFVRFDCEIPPPCLTEVWDSKPIKLTASFESSLSLMGDEAVYNLFINLIEDVIGVLDFSVKDSKLDSPDIFNLCFLTNLFLVVERHSQTPNKFPELIQRLKRHVETSTNLLESLQSSPKISKFLWSNSSELLEFLDSLYNQLNCSELKYAQKLLFNMLESNLEVKWLRSVNSTITSWNLQSKVEVGKILNRPVPISLSRSSSEKGFWKVELYHPLLSMKKESSHKSAEKKLLRSLYNHQIESVIQIHYEVDNQEDRVDVVAYIDNVRIDVVALNKEKKFENPEIDEKHFPSRISLNLNPICRSSVMSVTIRQSSSNPTIQVEVQRGIEAALQSGFENESSPSSPRGPTPNASARTKFTARNTVSTTIQPWKYEQYANNDTNGATIGWVLYDSEDGKRKVSSSEPPKKAHPWLNNRNSSANRPFTEQGGVIFTDDKYGQPICWRMDKSAIRDTMKWEIKGTIWLTYWPNMLKTSYAETRSAEFREVVHVNFT